MNCFICYEPTADNACEECLEQLVDVSRSEQHSSIHSLFKYDGLIRELIHEIKIANSVSVLQGLTSLVMNDPRLTSAVDDCDLIVPAPSSVWGRMRGRFDFAEALAIALSQKSAKPYARLPTRYYMRFRKRAGRNTDSMESDQVRNADTIKPNKRIASRTVLLLDDITTTGWTMQEYESVLVSLGAKSVYKLAVASAEPSEY